MNGHWHDVKVRIEKPVVDLHANSHNLDFDECFSVKALKSFPPLQCNSSMLRRSSVYHKLQKPLLTLNWKTPPPSIHTSQSTT